EPLVAGGGRVDEEFRALGDAGGVEAAGEHVLAAGRRNGVQRGPGDDKVARRAHVDGGRAAKAGARRADLGNGALRRALGVELSGENAVAAADHPAVAPDDHETARVAYADAGVLQGPADRAGHGDRRPDGRARVVVTLERHARALDKVLGPGDDETTLGVVIDRDAGEVV